MLSREPARHRKTPRHARTRRRTPARLRPATVLAASAWVAVVTVLASLLVTGASPRTMATPAPGSSAQAAAGAVVPDAVTRPAITQTARAERIARVSRAGQSGTARATGTSWTVRPGQTLSGIAGSWCGTSSDWTGLYASNKAVIGGNPNLIRPGQRYSRGCYQTRAPPGPAASPRARHDSGWGVIRGYPNYCGDGDGDGWDVPCQAASSPVRRSYSGGSVRRSSYSSRASYGAPGSYERCVIARESGGNSQVMNSSGHYGLYQFSSGTWQAYGGSAASFGHASASEQRRVFLNAMAQGGQSNWSPYDGCLCRVLGPGCPP